MIKKTHKILVTGGSGFIGSNFIYNYLSNSKGSIVNFDSLTYAGSGNNLERLTDEPRYHFVKGSICDAKKLTNLFGKFQFDSVINFAAESHVDRSIEGPKVFMETNIIGTFNLLDTIRTIWDSNKNFNNENFRFVHVSTDEVFGSLGPEDDPFNENSNYKPNSPYSASKASSDHIVRSYFKTYNFPVVITNCSNNFGPYQFPEKLIPLTIYNALNKKPIPIYGDGLQVRDWLYVKDHCDALNKVLQLAGPGHTYNIGGNNEKTNIDVVKSICNHLDEIMPNDKFSHCELIEFVKDRPGHDKRYSVDSSKIQKELNWKPYETFETGIKKTIKWYLDNQNWMNNIIRDKSHA